MTSPVRALWDAPAAVPGSPRRVWRDWPLVVAVALLAVLEASVRTDVPWRWLWAVVLIALAPTLLWRRSRPLTMLAIAFAVGTAVGLATAGDPQLYTTAYFLILLYAVFRWGSGRAMLAGGALVVIGMLLTFLATPPEPADIIGGVAVAVTTSTLGLAVRWRRRARTRELEQVRLLEREQLARDLHDTVAHHVSAIAIQAQAGSAVAATDPGATVQVLHAIEAEATRTLREMRAMVGVLRAPADALAPTPGLAEIRSLAQTDAAVPAVVVRVDGDLDTVPPAVAAAVFRIAQEAVTNARRHARDATRVEVGVDVDAGGVKLEVRDDGEGAASVSPGYGLTGMRERAALLGGACEAGPAPDGGWIVAATLPRAGWTA
ncbi:sensor histidine kinase [Microbacterium trichothecenolyticum]|uniref:sensor histidine kinase n=1 Tax=Microbacterium trichothecenolyticum TaxID=69370 RepID=UPI001C6F2D4E|nr:histidine kinase [Microbacterium trichothecenolyticum]MBW9120326.1 sensor histidine kinase [Microbacterium trichothecenolyticum]